MRMTMADVYERWLDWLILWLLVFACRNLLEFLAGIAGEPAGANLMLAADIAGYLALIVLAIASFSLLFGQTRFLWSLKGPKDLRQRGQLHPDNFVFGVIGRASTIAWFATLGILLLLGLLSERIAELPGDQVIKLVSFVLAASFCAAWLTLNLHARRRR